MSDIITQPNRHNVWGNENVKKWGKKYKRFLKNTVFSSVLLWEKRDRDKKWWCKQTQRVMWKSSRKIFDEFIGAITTYKAPSFTFFKTGSLSLYFMSGPGPMS